MNLSLFLANLVGTGLGLLLGAWFLKRRWLPQKEREIDDMVERERDRLARPCPVCGKGDFAFLRCHRPDCTDGR